MFAWQTVGDDHPDRYPLTLLGSLLSAGDTSRLSQSLVDRDRLALDVDDYDMVMRDVGLSGIALTPAPGVPLKISTGP